MIENKGIIFLGSSVTYGDDGYSFVESLEKNYHINVLKKEAVSSTTLVTLNNESYIPRLKRIDTLLKPDLFICQLSTNDASNNLPIGEISNSDNYNENTIIGAIESIISYAYKTWNTKVTFYTGTKYDSTNYQRMVEALHKIKEKWGIYIIDLWNDEDMNNISINIYNTYMKDPIHPNRYGYDNWWTPKFVEAINDIFNR